jgi:predicted ester cyclase
MTEDRKAVVRRYYELMETPERFDEVIAPDVKGHAGASADGLEEFTASQQSFREAFPDLRAEVAYLVEEGELVSTWISYLGTHDGAFAGVSPTGREIKIMGWDLMRVREGKIVEITSSCDLFTLMNQIGALSTAAPA